MNLPANTKPDSYWAAKKSLATSQEIYDWCVHDFNNFNNYPMDKYKDWLHSVKQFWADDFKCYMPGDSTPPCKGQEKYIGFIEMYHKCFNPLKIEIHDFFQSGDYVSVHYHMIGKFSQGTFMGIPPTGKEFRMRMIEIHKFANGQLIEGYCNGDSMSMLSQLGILKTFTEKFGLLK